jgi:uncharacterized phiE125 gp8 family phage protein
MTQFYNLKTEAASPIDLATAKAYLKVTSTSDDALIQILIDAVTQWGEKYTTRDFRAKTWELFIDVFAARISLRRSPVETIDIVTRLVSDVATTVPNTVYYLKKGTQFSEVLLNDGQDWPSDTDEREQAIEIEFSTVAFGCLDSIKNAILLHLAHVYTNRGDCGFEGDAVTKAAAQSGATIIYDGFRISRV